MVQIGDVLAGKYRVERVLGQGAMGMVVAAMHIDLHERRAIKFMLPTALGDADGIERFMREARACARLKSKHVAAVYDVGRLEDGAPYIVMEYLEGTDLKSVLQKKKALPVPQAVDYMLQALEAVGEAHQAGIIHRDLKPANMFVAAGVGGVPCIKILDFGIAKLTSSTGLGADFQEMTSTAAVMGSPLYMSPEQMRSSRYVDARCDIWSLGVILYRMVTGTLPFQGQTAPELFATILKDDPAPPSTLNPTLTRGLEAIILKCLHKEPSERWSSAAELANALRPHATEAAPRSASVVEQDGTTRHWRPSQASLPNGLYGAGSGAGSGSDSASRAAAALPSANHGVQGQTAPAVTEGGTIPISAHGGVSPGSNPLALIGSSAAMSSPIAVNYPAPRSSQPPTSANYPAPRASQSPLSLLPTDPPSIPLGVGHETGATGQTGDSWSEPVASPRPGMSPALMVVWLGGALLFLSTALLILVLRRSSGEVTVPETAPIAGQAADPAQNKPAPPAREQEPLVTVAEASSAPSVATTAASPSRPSPTAAPKPTTKPAAPPPPPVPPGPAPKPTRKPTQPNPFD